MQLLTPKDMLRYNAHQVLRLFKNGEEHSRADVARIVGCSRSTGSNIMQYLEDHNLVQPCGTGNDGVGRSSVLYKFNPSARCGIGIEVTKEHLSFLMADLQGDIVTSEEYPVSGNSPEDIAQSIRKGCYTFLDSLEKPYNQILGIGVMVPGPVSKNGQVMRSVPLSWPNPVNLQEMITDSNLPQVSIINDANAKALAEACFNLNNDSGNIIYLDNHNGFGSGFVDDKLNLMTGATATAMEVGKMYVSKGNSFVQADSFLVIQDKKGLTILEDGFNSANESTSDDVTVISDIFAQIIAQLSSLFNPKTVLLDVPYIKSDKGLAKIDKALTKYISEESLISRPALGLPVIRRKHSALGGVAHAFMQSPLDFVIKPSVF